MRTMSEFMKEQRAERVDRLGGREREKERERREGGGRRSKGN